MNENKIPWGFEIKKLIHPLFLELQSITRQFAKQPRY